MKRWLCVIPIVCGAHFVKVVDVHRNIYIKYIYVYIYMDCIGLYWLVLECMGLYCIVLDCIGLYGIVLDCIGLYWTVLDCIRLYCIGMCWIVNSLLQHSF